VIAVCRNNGWGERAPPPRARRRVPGFARQGPVRLWELRGVCVDGGDIVGRPERHARKAPGARELPPARAGTFDRGPWTAPPLEGESAEVWSKRGSDIGAKCGAISIRAAPLECRPRRNSFLAEVRSGRSIALFGRTAEGEGPPGPETMFRTTCGNAQMPGHLARAV